MEYTKCAKYYDLFYTNKDYEKEANFLKEILKEKNIILDAGCGTGTHMQILENYGYVVDGFDLNQEMLNIAKEKVKGNLYLGNILNYKSNKKYDAIISMFAVFNHLKSYDEFKNGIINLLKLLNDNGILVIDLHNGRKSGEKTDIVNSYKRIMKWEYDLTASKEYSIIKYITLNGEYETTHEFLIYDILKIKNILNKMNVSHNIYENYTFEKGTNTSKNIQIIIYK